MSIIKAPRVDLPVEIEGYPTWLILREGEIVWKAYGILRPDLIEQKFQELIG